MTRINTIDPVLLTDQHMMAEYRELPMVCAALRRSLRTQSVERIRSKIPAQYTLNKGHVLFFYDKGQYLMERYDRLIWALRRRGYEVRPETREVSFDVFEENDLHGWWMPTLRDHRVNIDRICQRVIQKPYWYRVDRAPINGYSYVKDLKILASLAGAYDR